MRKLIPFAAVLVALAVTHAGAKAPVPKDKPPPSIDGKYTLLATSSGVAADRGPGGFPKGREREPADAGFGSSPWASTRLTRGDTTITKNEITIEPRLTSGLPVTMEYTLDPTKSPMTIDAEIINARGKKTKALGVVEVNKNRLTIALATKEGAERPKSTEEAEGVTVYYFQKAPPPPKVEYRIVAMRVGGEAEAEKELNTLTASGFELVNTTHPLAPGEKSSPTTVHFILKRTTRQP